MCDPTIPSVPSSAYESIPLNIHSNDPLLNFGKPELTDALRMPHELPWIAEWLFKDLDNPFHRQTNVPPELFQNALALHLQHHVTTPDDCAVPTPDAAMLQSDSTSITFSKNIDLLLVPVARLDAVTVGYTFFKGFQTNSTRTELTPSEPNFLNPFSQPQPFVNFAIGRFAFDNKTRDHLMVVNGISPHITTIISMRWLSEITRNRCFFTVPKAHYGPYNLPSRVLTAQCNVNEFVMSTPSSQKPFSFSSSSTRKPHSFSYPFPSSNGTPNPPTPNSQPPITPLPTTPLPAPASFFATTPSLAISSDPNLDPSWAEGLDAFGTTFSPEGLNGSTELEDELSPDDTRNLFESLGKSVDHYSPDINPFTNPENDPFQPAQHPISPPLSPLTHMPNLAQAPVTFAGPASTSPSYWLSTLEKGLTPDGVGIPRRPAVSDTSSGAFEMSALFESLQAIEHSLKGSFSNSKARKNVMDPQTGALIGRSTGILSTTFQNIDAVNLQVFRELAAQSYYSSTFALTADNRLLTIPATAPLSLSMGFSHLAATRDLVPATDKAMYNRGAPAPLAPRPIPIVGPFLNGDENDTSANQSAKEAARLEKLEAKRIKNRISAARSNQKRRKHLETKRRELDSLRKKVKDLKSIKEIMVEENIKLKREARQSQSRLES